MKTEKYTKNSIKIPENTAFFFVMYQKTPPPEETTCGKKDRDVV
jgi:hypothetical protein